MRSVVKFKNSEHEDGEKFPRIVVDDDGMVVLRISKDSCLTLNAGEGERGNWRMFDDYSRWSFERMKDFSGTVELSND